MCGGFIDIIFCVRVIENLFHNIIKLLVSQNYTLEYYVDQAIKNTYIFTHM